MYFKRMQLSYPTGEVLSEWETLAEKADKEKAALDQRFVDLGLNIIVSIGDLS
jgi:hypothetical protein